MNIGALYIYPYKSGPGIAVKSANAGPRGFDRDRRFMVTNGAGGFLTQRTHPALGTPTARLTDDGFVLRIADLGEVVLAPPSSGAEVTVQVWSDQVEAVRCDRTTEDWFSELLQESVQVVYMPDAADRPTDGLPDVPLSFADGFPYLIATDTSLRDLNDRIDGLDVPMQAFRPSIVVAGVDEPWAEDAWDIVEVGDAAFRCTTNCERCSITTLDPAAPARPRRDGEPLRTLAKFRRNAKGKVDFARNAIAHKHGLVQVGDEVFVSG